MARAVCSSVPLSGAFGEISESINVLIQDFAHEGALKNPDKFGQSNYNSLWTNPLVAKAPMDSPGSHHGHRDAYAGLGYAGGSAQQQAAAFHAQAQA
jgi:hypothetical protein